MKTAIEILMKTYEAEDSEELQMMVTSNPQLKYLIEAMEEYASQFKKEEKNPPTDEQKIFYAGWKACESHFDPMSEIGGGSLQIKADFEEYLIQKGQ